MGAGDPYHKALHCWSVVHGFTNLYTEGRFEWLGVTSKNAEAALKSLLDQFLAGSKNPMAPTDFSPLNTKESSSYKDMMEKLKFN